MSSKFPWYAAASVAVFVVGGGAAFILLRLLFVFSCVVWRNYSEFQFGLGYNNSVSCGGCCVRRSIQLVGK